MTTFAVYRLRPTACASAAALHDRAERCRLQALVRLLTKSISLWQQSPRLAARNPVGAPNRLPGARKSLTFPERHSAMSTSCVRRVSGDDGRRAGLSAVVITACRQGFRVEPHQSRVSAAPLAAATVRRTSVSSWRRGARAGTSDYAASQLILRHTRRLKVNAPSQRRRP